MSSTVFLFGGGGGVVASLCHSRCSIHGVRLSLRDSRSMGAVLHRSSLHAQVTGTPVYPGPILNGSILCHTELYFGVS